MSTARVSPYVSVRTVVVLRAAAQARALRRAILAAGAAPVLLPALRLAPMPDPTRAARALRAALASDCVVFTSPAAVRYAAALGPLQVAAGTRVFAPGRGTARALARHGIAALHPGAGAMHSEGLLALPEFEARGGERVGLVTAPGGRGLIAATVHARGARLARADVYRRLPPRLDRRHFEALRLSAAPRALLLTSAEALQHVLAGLPPELCALLREARVAASSARLGAMARAEGFAQVAVASTPEPDALLAVLRRRSSAA